MWVEQERGSLPPARKSGGPASLTIRWKQRQTAPASERPDAGAAAAQARAEGGRSAEDVLGVTETARILGVSRTTVYLALADGRLSGEKVGHRWRVDPRSVDAWVERETSLFDRAAAAMRRLRRAAPVATVLAFLSPTAVARAVAAIRSAPEHLGGDPVTGRRAYAAGIAAAVAGAAIITVLTLSDGVEQQQGGSEGSSSGPVHVVSGGDGDATPAAPSKSGNPDERTVSTESSAKRARSDDGVGPAGGATEVASGGSGGEVSEPPPSAPSPAPEGKPPPSGEAPSPAPPAPAAPPPQPPPSAGGTDPTASPPPASETGVQPADGGTGGVDTGVGG